jgi:hypothetical protein
MSADLNKTRIAFMERASAPNVPPHAFKLAWLIAYRYLNRKTWTAYPPQERLARDLNASIRTVQRLLDILEPLGLTIVPGDGRGHASTYSIDPERATRVSSFAAQKGDKKGRQKAPKRVSPVSPQPIENQEESFVGELKLSPQRLERDDRTSCEEIPSLGGDPPADAGPRQESLPLTAPPNARRESKRTPDERIAFGETESEPQAPRKNRGAHSGAQYRDPSPRGVATARESLLHGTTNTLGHSGPKSEPSPCGTVMVQNNFPHGGGNSGDDLRELRALWDRGWASDDSPKAQAIARNAFERACREAEPSVILDGAKTWIAAADAPRFLPALATWLAARGWETPPPTKRGRRANGHKAQRSNGYAKPDMFKTVLVGEGYREDTDGHLYWSGDAGDDEPISTSMWGGGR